MIANSANRRNLDLEPLNLAPGTVVHAEVRDPVGPDGIDWVRNPSTGNSARTPGFNGPRFVQTRTWTVGDTTVTAERRPRRRSPPTRANTRPLASDEIVYVETNHPNDRVLPVAWRLNGTVVANPSNSRNLDLGAIAMPGGTHTLTATVTDGALSDTVEWKIDKVAPTAARTLSAPLTTLADDLEHPVYFNGWDMLLDPKDDTTGYEGTPAVVGQLRLNKDGWFNYFGFPEQPMPTSPFQFRHSGTDVKALTYGNLGTGGLSRATFEQTLPDDHPSGRFIPGFGTHFVEHRAIDPAGNYGMPGSYRATVLPGSSPACTTTLTGNQASVNATTGVTCLNNATVSGGVTVAAGASLVAKASTIGGALNATGAEAVQLFGTTVNGAAQVRNSAKDVTIAGGHVQRRPRADGQHAGHRERALQPPGRRLRPDPGRQHRPRRAHLRRQQRRGEGLRRQEPDLRQLQRLRAGSGRGREPGRRQRAGHAVADVGHGGAVRRLHPGRRA